MFENNPTKIFQAVYLTELGKLQIRASQTHVLGVKFVTDDFYCAYSQSNQLTDLCITQIHQYINAKRFSFDLPIYFNGSDFQQKVWQQLSEIPYGETKSYKEIAVAINNPNAARAVGMACNANKLGIIIPCHRVVGSNKKLVGYAGGLNLKLQLLNIEANAKLSK